MPLFKNSKKQHVRLSLHYPAVRYLSIIARLFSWHWGALQSTQTTALVSTFQNILITLCWQGYVDLSLFLDQISCTCFRFMLILSNVLSVLSLLTSTSFTVSKICSKNRNYCMSKRQCNIQKRYWEIQLNITVFPKRFFF